MSSTTRPPTRVIGIGASAGGIEALTKVLSVLPAGLPHVLCVTQHVAAAVPSALPVILGRHCALPVSAAEHLAPLKAGHVYVAPPDRHVIVVDGRIELTRGPKENGVRPAIDTMLRSIAGCGPRGVAVVLSGALGDGSGGASLVLQAGGDVFVQDPEDALVSSMPERALALVDGGARVLSADEIGHALAALDDVKEANLEMPEPHLDTSQQPEGPATGFTCPECHGAIWEIREGDAIRYRCRVGHAYSEDAMIAEQSSAVEAALWSALEVLQERAELLRKAAERQDPNTRLRAHFHAAADDADVRVQLIRRALGTGDDENNAFSVPAAG